MQLHGLVQDGVGFSRARINAKLGSRRGEYQPMSTSQITDHDGQDTGKHSGDDGVQRKSKSKSKTKKSSKAISTRSKDTRQHKQGPRGGSSVTEAHKASTPNVAKETADEERERLLREERTAGVHSSQQAIKVVGLNN